ncbi:hypothetical protein J2736_001700 [Paenibacillus qinlingensis]|uniref:Uncharacterized protein n=1 Tax=Paenibacillus qinlingensis TaxID=1837343 RepID=A0ABU1NSU1_9BACL|nr:hypothetical protein [Paenibacillus qinlingensis]
MKNKEPAAYSSVAPYLLGSFEQTVLFSLSHGAKVD